MIAEDFRKVFEPDSTNSTGDDKRVDLVLTPTCFHDTLKYDDYLKQEQVFDEKDFFTACVNVAGLPAISIPSSLTRHDRLPIGIQLIANWRHENLLLNAANWFVKNKTIDIV